ncbi:hypothetical protein HZS_1811, partial [Henneguya salminicola]
MNFNPISLYSFLSENGYNLNQDWYSACTNFITDNFHPDLSFLTQNTFKEQIIEQFLLSDISETSNPSLENHENIRLIHIKKNIVLQANFCISISESFYSQLNNATDVKYLSVKNKQKNDENTPRDSTYLLELTDGFSKCRAITLNKMDWINREIKPGFKLLVKSRTECRWNVILLQPSNCDYLGGFSENAIEAYTHKNIISRFIDIPKNAGNLGANNCNNKVYHVDSVAKPHANIGRGILQDLDTYEILPKSKPLPPVISDQRISKITPIVNAPTQNKDYFNDSFNLSQDSLDDFIENIGDEEMDKIVEASKVEIKSYSTKKEAVYQTLNFKSIPHSLNRPFKYLNEIPQDSYVPFICRCMVFKIDDGIITCEAYVSNTLLFGPPFLASKALICSFLQ